MLRRDRKTGKPKKTLHYNPFIHSRRSYDSCDSLRLFVTGAEELVDSGGPAECASSFRELLGDLCTESGQTLEGSFAAVSTLLIARKDAFFSIFRDLQDFHSFAPLRIQNFSKNLLHFFRIFIRILQKFSQNFLSFSEISPEFH